MSLFPKSGTDSDFRSLSRLAGLADVEVQAMSGHKSLEMLGVYTHAKQVTQLDVCRNVFEQTFKNNAKDFADNVDRGGQFFVCDIE
jgi:hypothetical protein